MFQKKQTGSKGGSTDAHPYNLRQAMKRFEQGHISNILELTRWNRAKAARMLGINPDLLASKIRDYQLSEGNKPLHKRKAKQY